MSKTSMISMLAGASLLLTACGGAAEMEDEVSFDILNASGAKIGTIEIDDEGAEGVEITVSVSGLEPGVRAMHLHETGVCTAPDFTSAGGHYNPGDTAHGQVEDGPHAGDMMNIEIKADGTGLFEVRNERVSLRGTNGLPALMDADGSALIIHAGADDYETQPTGGAGGRVACAVIPAG